MCWYERVDTSDIRKVGIVKNALVICSYLFYEI